MKTKKYDVIALGELLVDMAEGSTSDQGNMTFEACPGGAPCNVLAFLKHAEHSVGFIGKVGDDFLGHMLGSTVESVGIDTKGLVYDPDAKTTLAFVHKKPDGDRDFSFYRKPGADMLLRADEVSEDYLKEARIFHFGTLSSTDEPVKSATRKAVRIAKENGLMISFDPNLREPLWSSLSDAKEEILWGLEQCDILKISDNEVTFLTGIEDMKKDREKVFSALRKMSGACAIFVTLGPEGSMGWIGNEIVYAPANKVENVVDTTGAGDTFMGSVLHALLSNSKEGQLTFDGMDLGALLAAANHNASEVTKKKGALKVMKDIVIA